ncbi:MAG: hypothetical protein MJ151_02925, partial [Lachnospiraceae bacterium]|nr:hypothetical protein [Lachnospiraceae bacterium]
MEKTVVKTYIKEESSIDMYGNIMLEISMSECIGKYFEFGDTVRANFLGYSIVMPVVHSYKVGLIGEPQLVFLTEHDDPKGFIGIIYIDSTMSRFKLGTQNQDIDKNGDWKIYDNIKFPIEVELYLEEKGGYKDNYEVRTLHRSNDRKDYPTLTDEEYA